MCTEYHQSRFILLTGCFTKCFPSITTTRSVSREKSHCWSHHQTLHVPRGRLQNATAHVLAEGRLLQCVGCARILPGSLLTLSASHAGTSHSRSEGTEPLMCRCLLWEHSRAKALSEHCSCCFWAREEEGGSDSESSPSAAHKEEPFVV